MLDSDSERATRHDCWAPTNYFDVVLDVVGAERYQGATVKGGERGRGLAGGPEGQPAAASPPQRLGAAQRSPSPRPCEKQDVKTASLLKNLPES
eukprot:8923735-Pyramimonas_sp.AAC.1